MSHYCIHLQIATSEDFEFIKITTFKLTKIYISSFLLNFTMLHAIMTRYLLYMHFFVCYPCFCYLIWKYDSFFYPPVIKKFQLAHTDPHHTPVGFGFLVAEMGSWALAAMVENPGQSLPSRREISSSGMIPTRRVHSLSQLWIWACAAWT